MSETKRHISAGAEEWLGVTQNVLNGGEIELVDYMGSEEQMVGIARISHGKILPHTEPDKAQSLINYFMENRHTSPFEFIETTWRWRLPIFVARQVVRHRTANINEQSARYSELGAMIYMPRRERVQGQDTKNKQGSAGELSDEVRDSFIHTLEDIQLTSSRFYKKSLDSGIAKETARIHLPVGVYTNWVWKMDLHNLFHFLGLRMDPHAQYEVRVYAEAMWTVLQDAYPMCCKAFEEYRYGARTFSRTECEVMSGFMEMLRLNGSHITTGPVMDKILAKLGVNS